MCTVSFVPDVTGGGYLLATNRDERPSRGPASPPTLLQRDGTRFVAPLDGEAGGTWVAADEAGRTLCLLNGEEPAAKLDPAPPSRGLLALSLMEDADPYQVAAQLRRRAMRLEMRESPFQLLLAVPGRDGLGAQLYRYTWDRRSLADVVPRREAHLAVSSMWRRVEVGVRRRWAFARLLARLPADADARAEALFAWHAGHEPGAPEGDGFSVCRHGTDARTVSSMLVRVDAVQVRLRYRAGQPCRTADEQVCALPRAGR